MILATNYQNMQFLLYDKQRGEKDSRMRMLSSSEHETL